MFASVFTALQRRDRYDQCTQITPDCPVEATTYTYYPNLGSNIFFLVWFAVFMVFQLFLGIRYRTWTFLIALGVGCLGEAVGYVGRIIMHSNPWSQTGFDMQICCLIISPAFIAAGIYLTLKHIVLEVGPTLSRLPARYYTWIFIFCDLLSLVLQGAGGGIAATALSDAKRAQTGNNMMMAGIVWQVLTLLIFAGFALDFVWSVRRHVKAFNSEKGAMSKGRALPESAYALLGTRRFRFFAACVTLAYITIFTRCVYRIAEMAHGWRNSIMIDETDFIILDGMMMAIAVLALTVAHPGFAFPEMQMHKLKNWRGEAAHDTVAGENGI